MAEKHKHKKRPCRVCRKWFTPNPRLRDRQRTCGDEECQRKWHAKKCAEWNRRNPAYFREIYLRGRLEPFGTVLPEQSPSSIESCRINDPPRRSSSLDLPQEVIQEVIRRQLVETQREVRRLAPSSISRGDGEKPP